MLKAIIEQCLEQTLSGQITFEEYMEIVLYHPQYGYYASQIADIGRSGDFFTASSLGRDFGELLGIQFAEMWQVLGEPTPFHLIEMGAGNGRLALDILQFLEQSYPDLWKVLNFTVVESSPRLREIQSREINERFNDLSIVAWKTWEEIPDHSVCGCFFSNELVDAFPVHRLAIESGVLKEIYLTDSQGKLREILGDLSNSGYHDIFSRYWCGISLIGLWQWLSY